MVKLVGKKLSKEEKMDISFEQMIRNVTATYIGATDLERDEGMRWYEAARALARALAETHWGSGRPRDVRRAAGVIAVLSPNVSWGRNVQLATLAFKDGKASGTFSRNTDKADKILAGADPADVIGGPKVTNFFQNILTGGENDGVTVDRHAAHIAMGRILSDDERGKLLKVTKAFDGYGRIVDAYREAAWRLGIAPAKLQAVTWTAHRNGLEGRVR